MPADEQARLHVNELNMDYAGKEFYESSKYTNIVIVQVKQEMIEQAAGKGVSIAFGLDIGDASQTPDLNDWAVFDDFRLIYVSNTEKEDLILDELRGDLEYLKDGITYKTVCSALPRRSSGTAGTHSYCPWISRSARFVKPLVPTCALPSSRTSRPPSCSLRP